MDRRRFISYVAAFPLVAVGACTRRSRVHPQPICQETTKRFLSKEQRTTLDAICCRLIPTDQDPGAKEANVINYIDQQLILPHFKVFQKLFTEGAVKTNALAHQSHNQSFANLAPEQQDKIITRMVRGMRMGRRRNTRSFMQALLIFSVEGFLGDPVYGGNRNKVGWKFIGFEPRPPRPRCPYVSSLRTKFSPGI